VLDVIREEHPMVLSLLIDRNAWLRELRVCEGPDGNCHRVWDTIQQIVDG
jgi:hypothetical protein